MFGDVLPKSERILHHFVAVNEISLRLSETKKRSREWISSGKRVKIYKLEYKLLPHLVYSLDLAPSDYVLFPNQTKRLDGKKFGSNERTITEKTPIFRVLRKTIIWKE